MAGGYTPCSYFGPEARSTTRPVALLQILTHPGEFAYSLAGAMLAPSEAATQSRCGTYHPETKNMHILILGSGVIGTTTAYYLARAGHQVTVVDRQPGPALETRSEER